MPRFPGFLYKNLPSRFVRLKVGRIHMVHPYRIIDRRKQWLDAFHSVGDRPWRDAQSLQSKLLDDTICGALQVKLFQQ